MNTPDLLTKAQNALWLTRLGRAEGRPGMSTITDLGLWHAFIKRCVADEFTLSHNRQPTALDDLQWFSEDGPNPNVELQKALDAGRSNSSVRQALHQLSLPIHQVILSSLRDIPESPWLVIEATDLRVAFQQSAMHAFGMAVAEVYFGFPGFWYSIVDFFANGFWPCGVNSLNDIVVV